MTVKTTCTILEQLHDSGYTDTLVEAISAAGLQGDLSTGGYTVFAPVDSAFEALEPGALDGLLADRSALRSVLMHHVATGVHMAADVIGGSSVPTLSGGPVSVEVTSDGVIIGGARVVKSDVLADNGVIHYIDGVIVPSS